MPQIYIPYTCSAELRLVTFTVRTGSIRRYMAKSVQQVIWSMDKELPVTFQSQTFRDHLRRGYFSQPRFVMTMSVAFASSGTHPGFDWRLQRSLLRRLAADAGDWHSHGAGSASHRRAPDGDDVGAALAAVGIGIGVPASIALAKILQNRIWGIKSADPLTLVAVSLLLTVVGLAACYFPCAPGNEGRSDGGA